MSPADIAALALGAEPDAVTAIEPVKHGLTNESWIVRTQADAVVVRLSGRSDTALQIDRESEAAVIAAVAAAGIGPPALLCEPARRILVTRYLGEPWSREDAARGQNIERLARLLRSLHELAVPAGVRKVELRDTVHGYLRTLDERGVRGNLTAQALRDCAIQAVEALRGRRLCLCHNDVHHLNIIDDGRLRLIDWEYAGIGEPLFDLASVCIYHGYSKERRNQLLGTYAAGGASVNAMQFELACWLFDYVRELWTAVRDGG